MTPSSAKEMSCTWVASKISQFIWLVFGMLEVLIGIRVVLGLAARVVL